ncbi:hypothetical protein KP509_1Z041300 [Ceratopteris richardii]|nr:hypothetical protein KP509_1Z041300 [Ceratopteris richardii]
MNRWRDRAFATIVVAMALASGFQVAYSGQQFNQNFFVGWAPQNTFLSNGGSVMNLKLDSNTGSGFQSRNTYLHGYVSMSIKLPPRNSAGVVVTYYMSSPRNETTTNWDEIDFEFLGNVTGQPWILHTNIFTSGQGGREERIFLWFDPTKAYHTYSILWNDHQIVWYVDARPIRVYRNTPVTRATYPKWKPMNLYSSIWNGDSWATRGGLEKINWTYAPFIASYTNFKIDACPWKLPGPAPACFTNSRRFWWDQPSKWTLNASERSLYTSIRKRYTVYDYCKDFKRYPVPMPECSVRPW